MSQNKQQVKKIILHTGNILENQELVRKVGKTTLEELRACIKTTLNEWNKGTSPSEVLEIKGSPSDSSSEQAPKGCKTTVKVFLSENSRKHVEDAISTVKRQLQTSCLDTLIVIPPDVSDDVPLSELKPVWEALEASVASRDVGVIGIADLTPQLFKELYQWAEVKPSVIQVNLSSCCTVSEELTNFATQRHVQVLTHNDDPEVIDEDIIATILSRAELSGADCSLAWLARHRIISTCYGLVTSKGYTLSMGIGSDEGMSEGGDR